jgi:hypothetical protein
VTNEGFANALSDDELTELALAADPGAPLPDNAVPIDVHLARTGPSLPIWYMPPVVARGGRRWKTPVVLVIVGAFLLIEAMGLCNTYGLLQFA